jgi:hypothetical protein
MAGRTGIQVSYELRVSWDAKHATRPDNVSKTAFRQVDWLGYVDEAVLPS